MEFNPLMIGFTYGYHELGLPDEIGRALSSHTSGTEAGRNTVASGTTCLATVTLVPFQAY